MGLDHGVFTLSLPAGVHLKRRFLAVKLTTHPGTLTLGPLPPTDGRDEAGDPVWHGTLRVPLHGQGLGDSVVLQITYQPCTEGPGSVCYLPQHRLLTVSAADLQGGAR